MTDEKPFFKICIQKAKTPQEWESMQADYIQNALEMNAYAKRLEYTLRAYSCGCKENECEVKPKYAPLKCGWSARQALEGK